MANEEGKAQRQGWTRTRQMSGRRIIKTSAESINRDNVVDELLKAVEIHNANRNEIEYLWKYYKGEQPILSRVKEERSEITNKIVENRANEIVSFKVGYLCGEPIQYVSRSDADNVIVNINRLNSLMLEADKASKDQEIAEWQMICGTSYRAVLPNNTDDIETMPFEIYTLDPRDTFIVYSTEIGNKPLMAVKMRIDADDVSHYSVYTDESRFKIVNSKIEAEEALPYKMMPIFEYPANSARLGSFEIVLPLLDALNNVASNRMDGVEQFVQALLVIIGAKVKDGDFASIRENGGLELPEGADVRYLVQELNQMQTQALKDDMYNSILTICGMPNRNGGSSTSDTGAAVLLRDGWSLAEARAKDSEHIFKSAEKKMLRLVLKMCREIIDMDIRLSDIELKFTRRNYDNMQSKAQVLDMLLKNDKVDPLDAYVLCGAFPDPESAYTRGMDYYNKNNREVEKTQNSGREAAIKDSQELTEEYKGKEN